MSLYMMIEFKNPDDGDGAKILPKYTVNERIFEEVFDFRKNQS
jgi:hypothetical protein